MNATTRDLIVHANLQQSDHLIDRMTQAAMPPWSRSTEAEGNIGDAHFRVFARKACGQLPEAAVALYIEDDRIEVVNITPKHTGHLPPLQYNAILQDFSATLLGPAAASLGLSVVTSLPVTSLLTQVGPEAADLLKSFSGIANKATGSSHPADFKRWGRFLVCIHRQGIELDTGLLQATLQEQGWSAKQADKLVREYEFARDLLQVADEAG